MMLRSILVLLTVALASGLPCSAAAQSELQMMLGPELGKQIPRGDFRVLHYPDEPVEDQPTDLGWTDYRISFTLPIWQNSRDESTIFANADLEEFKTDAVLPDNGVRFPDELWEIRMGATYRHKFDNGWIGGGTVTVGSASDEPFSSTDEMSVRVGGLLRVPHGERNAWIFSLFYASDAEVFGGDSIPPIYPGIAYQYEPSDRFRAIIGFPFTSIEYRPVEKLTLEATYLPIRRVRARATYQVFRPLRAYLGFDSTSEYHFLADRGDKDDKFFYYEMRVTAGARFDLRHVGFEIRGGRAFQRFFFEGEGYEDRHDNRIDVGDGWFMSAGVSVRF